MLNVIHVQFAEFKSWMLVCDAKRIINKTNVSSFGESAIILFTTVVCPCGLLKIIDVHFVKKNGLYKELASEFA